MDLRAYLAIARRWWWLVVIGSILAGGAAWFVTLRITPIYQARAVLLVNQVQNPSAVTYSDIQASQQLTKTYAELVTSSINLDQSIQKLNDPTLSTKLLKTKVGASAVTGTQLVEVTAKDPSPQRAALIANSVTSVFPQYIEEAQLAGKPTAGGQPLNTVFVAEQASVPTAPISPKKTLNVALGTFLGLVVMLGAVATLEYFDDGIDEREDVESLGVPFLGSVAFARRPKGANKKKWVPNMIEGGSAPALAESYRQVQASLAFALTATEAKTILVTSASAGEGKSTTATNLASALAESSKRVLLIDGDFRKPDVHRYFSLPNSAGFSSMFLADIGTWPSFLRHVNDRLAVLTSGPLPPNPTELLGSNKMKAILASMADRFDIIVIDSPPLLALADASLWASLAEAILIVTRQGKTRRGTFNEALTTARASRKPVIGVVINAVHRKKRDDYYYRYGYGYKNRDKANS